MIYNIELSGGIRKQVKADAVVMEDGFVQFYDPTHRLVMAIRAQDVAAVEAA